MASTITLKTVYEASKRIMTDLLNGEPNDFRVEQVEVVDDSDYSVVVSYIMDNPNKMEKGLFGVTMGTLTLPFERIYKKIQMSNNGEFRRLLMYEHK